MNTSTTYTQLADMRFGSPLRIVVIDNKVDLLDSFHELLSMLGYDVKVATDGESGVELVNQTHPSVVICDIGLSGGLDGFAVARAIRANSVNTNCTLIALLDYSGADFVREALVNGFDLYLRKPVQFEQLEEQLRIVQIQRQYTLH